MAKRTDFNQREIVSTFRKLGAKVLIMSDLGKGAPDILVGHRKRNWLFEIKDGKKMPSQQKLTPMEEEFHRTWQGQVGIINSVDDVISFMNDLNRG